MIFVVHVREAELCARALRGPIVHSSCEDLFLNIFSEQRISVLLT